MTFEDDHEGLKGKRVTGIMSPGKYNITIDTDSNVELYPAADIHDTQLDKTKVRSILNGLKPYIAGVQWSEDDWKDWLKELGL